MILYCGVSGFPSLCCLGEVGGKPEEGTPPDPSLNGTRNPKHGRRGPLVLDPQVAAMKLRSDPLGCL